MRGPSQKSRHRHHKRQRHLKRYRESSRERRNRGCMLLALPDEVLLQVLALLDTRQLLRVRGVCRRLGRLALDPHLWRRRSPEPGAATRAVLQAAPRAARVALSDDQLTSLADMALLAANTRCAVTSLELQVGRSSAAVAALVIRNQAALGKLRNLKLELIQDEDAEFCGLLVHLLALACSLPQLEELQAGDLQDLVPVSPLWLPPAAAAVSPSLRRLRYLAWRSDPYVEQLLLAHAPSLRRVEAPFKFPGRCLGRARRLRSLECELLDDMSLVPSAALTSLKLHVYGYEPDGGEPVARFVREAAAFLRAAPRLDDVTLHYDADLEGPEVLLVAALADVDRPSSVRSLKIDFDPDERFDNGLPPPQLLPLAACLPWMPHLRTLRIGNLVSDAFLEAITADAVPALARLVLFVSNVCLHTWIHSPAVAALAGRKPRLHLVATGYWFEDDGMDNCEYCLEGCHEPLTDALRMQEDNSVTVSFYSHREGERCKYHRDGLSTLSIRI